MSNSLRNAKKPLLLSIAIFAMHSLVLAEDNSSDAPYSDQLRKESKALRELLQSQAARDFLDATDRLPEFQPRTLYRDDVDKTYFTAEAVEELSKEKRDALTEVPVTEKLYYTTKYGTPLAYARVIELYSQIDKGGLSGRRILDFGYGTIGHLRMMGMCGAHTVGIEVDPMLPEMYSQPGDQGRIQNPNGKPGSVRLVHGRYPEIRMQVGVGYDLITSKNTLKNGFFNPERPVPKERLMDLGVGQSEFVKTIYGILKPGGVFIIYNICPAPSRPDEPYKHWADGRCPFSRQTLESAGFDVVAYNQNDDATTRAMAKKLGWDQGEYAMNLEDDLFGSYTILVKLPNRRRLTPPGSTLQTQD